MGTSHDDFRKYPRTPHVFGSVGTDDDKHLDERATHALLADRSLIVEEKLDGTNVGLHFAADGRLVLQCRGHLITEGMHPQYDLVKQWVQVKRVTLEPRLEDRYILFGEWLYATHSIHYRRLPHYFFEFDVYDKVDLAFLDLDRRTALLAGTGIHTVPIVHRGPIDPAGLERLIGPSRFDAVFEHPESSHTDARMEGLYLRTEADGVVRARAKLVRPEFVDKVKLSAHWQHRAMTPNGLADDAELWS